MKFGNIASRKGVANMVQKLKFDELKTDFLVVAAHELKTPLAPSLIQAQMLLGGSLGSLTDKQKKSINIIFKNMKHLNVLITNILSDSKMQVGEFKVKTEKGRLDECLKDSISTMKPLADKKGVALTVKIPALPEISFDVQRVRQVLINLLDNAIAFTKRGGKITIETVKRKDNILVSVEDTGIGIPKKAIPKMFTSFYQVESSLTRVHKGSGLGLAICKSIIEQHGGKIWVESELRKGSTFYFTLPLKSQKG